MRCAPSAYSNRLELHRMPTIAVVGAGPQFGAEVARTFSKRGYQVALVSRSREKLADLLEELANGGAEVAHYPADVRDSAALKGALATASDHFGGIDVLEYSPLPAENYLRPVLDTTPDQVHEAFEFSVLGPISAVSAVLPEMLAKGRGSLLFVSGGSSLVPNEKVAGTSIAMAGEAAYLTMLHEALKSKGVRVRHLVVPVRIGPGEPLGDPVDLAETLWRMHDDSESFRAVVGGSS